MADLTVPTLNSNDIEYELIDWCAADGSPITTGQAVAVIETSKATEELLAPASGRLRQVLRVGARCRPGTVIGVIHDRFDDHPDSEPFLTAQPGNTDPADDLVLTDAARALIDEHRIAMHRVRALGRRIVRGVDVTELIEQPLSAAGDLDAEVESLPLSRLQRAVATTVAPSVRVPAAFTAVKVYLAVGQDPASVPERVIEATAALRPTHREFFALLAEDQTLRISPGAQIGVTVDVGTGLYVPVLHDAHLLSRSEIGAALLRFRVKARRGRFTSSDLSGANIAVTLHTGAAVVIAQPIIQPGHTCALSVCATQEEVQLRPDGSVVSRCLFNLGLAYDHRVINGRDAMGFLDAIKVSIER